MAGQFAKPRSSNVEKVGGVDDLLRLLTGQRIGEAARLVVLRGSERVELQIVPAEGKARKT